jgi:BolA family transcriptional regulator, general stress-responsive regulator
MKPLIAIMDEKMTDVAPSLPLAELIAARLRASLQPTRLEVVDESHLHAGHAGARPGGETHFRVRIASPLFARLSRINRERSVHAPLADLLPLRIHALAIEILGQ